MYDDTRQSKTEEQEGKTLKLPLPSWKDRLPRRRKTADTAAAAEPVAGAHRKKKKTRKLKKKVVIPLAVVGVAGIAFGVHHVLTAGATDIVQTFTESEATRQDTRTGRLAISRPPCSRAG